MTKTSINISLHNGVPVIQMPKPKDFGNVRKLIAKRKRNEKINLKNLEEINDFCHTIFKGIIQIRNTDFTKHSDLIAEFNEEVLNPSMDLFNVFIKKLEDKKKNLYSVDDIFNIIIHEKNDENDA